MKSVGVNHKNTLFSLFLKKNKIVMQYCYLMRITKVDNFDSLLKKI